jgi:murein DD-endopeptidase MepM/ murein hydrolase activator NlpD
MGGSIRKARAGILAGVLLAGLAGRAGAAADNAGKGWSANFRPARPVNGSPIVFRVKAPAGVESLRGEWLEHRVFFAFDRKAKLWYGLAGASLETKAGSYTLNLQGTTKSGQSVSFEEKIRVARASYPTIAVTVARQYTEPSPEQVEQSARDKAIKQAFLNRITPERQWAGDFRPPVEARISDVFGTERTFNGQVQSSHQGLDFAVPAGTPVAALNSGTVLLAQPMFFEGNFVVIDHGQGLLSLYLHLSEFKVAPGDHVVGGQVLGLSGASGRATGPHLHVAVRWQGMYLNPAELVALKLP